MIFEYYGPSQSCLTAFIDMLSCQFSNSTKRVGVINWWWLNDEELNLDKLKAFVEQQDICFFLSEEIFEKYNSININDVFSLLNKYNVYYILFSEDHSLTVKPAEDKSFYYPWFFKSPLYVPSNFKPELVYREKPYTFNLMLGSKKPYRTLLYKLLKDNKNIYSSYLGHPKFKNQSLTFLEDEDILLDLTNQNVEVDKLNTMNSIQRENERHVISHVVPEKIYADTHFDIVTETFVKHSHNFLTEKTAKPLATGRFFYWYASSGLIPYLERYGFIFDYDLISYDSITNDVDRLDDVLNLIEELSANKNLVKEIYEKTSYVREHNMRVYWEGRTRFAEDLYGWLLACVQRV